MISVRSLAAVTSQEESKDDVEEQAQTQQLYVPCRLRTATYPRLSGFTPKEHAQFLKIVSEEQPFVLGDLDLGKPTDQDYEDFKAAKALYLKEQAEFQLWGRSMWTHEHCSRALHPIPTAERVYEAEFKMKAQRMSGFPKYYSVAAHLTLSNALNDCHAVLQMELIGVTLAEMPTVVVPIRIDQPIRIMNADVVPEPCSKHPCQFVLPSEQGMSIAPMTDIHSGLATFAIYNDANFVASENALKCLTQWTRPWMIPVSVCKTKGPDGEVNVTVLDSEFHVQKEIAPMRTYKAFRHMLAQTLIPWQERVKIWAVMNNRVVTNEEEELSYDGPPVTPVTQIPVTEVPVIKITLAEVPVTEVPVTEVPVTEVPVTEVPVTEVPVTEVPVTDVPVTEVSVTEEPVTEVPVTEIPLTEASVTEVPVTEAPVTEAPVTEAPVTDALVTEAPNEVANRPMTPEPISVYSSSDEDNLVIVNDVEMPKPINVYHHSPEPYQHVFDVKQFPTIGEIWRTAAAIAARSLRPFNFAREDMPELNLNPVQPINLSASIEEFDSPEPSCSSSEQGPPEGTSNACKCEGTMFEKPTPRSYRRWSIAKTGGNEKLDIIVHCAHKAKFQSAPGVGLGYEQHAGPSISAWLTADPQPIEFQSTPGDESLEQQVGTSTSTWPTTEPQPIEIQSTSEEGQVEQLLEQQAGTSTSTWPTTEPQPIEVKYETGELLLEPIPEYQIEIGASNQTPDAVRSVALSLALRDDASVLNVRVDGPTGEVVTIEKLTTEEFNEKHPNVKEEVFTTIHTLLSQLQDLRPGHYVLKHEISHGPSVMLLRTAIPSDENELILNFPEVNPPANVAQLNKFPPTISTALLPHLKLRQMLPCAFTPFEDMVGPKGVKRTASSSTAELPSKEEEPQQAVEPQAEQADDEAHDKCPEEKRMKEE